MGKTRDQQATARSNCIRPVDMTALVVFWQPGEVVIVRRYFSLDILPFTKVIAEFLHATAMVAAGS